MPVFELFGFSIYQNKIEKINKNVLEVFCKNATDNIYRLIDVKVPVIRSKELSVIGSICYIK